MAVGSTRWTRWGEEASGDQAEAAGLEWRWGGAKQLGLGVLEAECTGLLWCWIQKRKN